MSTLGDKIQKDKGQQTRIQRNIQTSKQFVDNRPKTIIQRNLQEIANNSSRTNQLKAIQKIANNNPKTTQLQTSISNKSEAKSSIIQRDELMLTDRPWGEVERPQQTFGTKNVKRGDFNKFPTEERTLNLLVPGINQPKQSGAATTQQRAVVANLQQGTVEKSENRLDNFMAGRWNVMRKDQPEPVSKAHWGHRTINTVTRLPFTPLINAYQLVRDVIQIPSNYKKIRKDLGAFTSGLMIAHNMIKKIATIASWSALICTLLALVPGWQFFAIPVPIMGMIAFWAHAAQFLTSSVLGISLFSGVGLNDNGDNEHVKYYKKQIVLDGIMGILGGLSGGLFGGALSPITKLSTTPLSAISGASDTISKVVAGSVGPGGKAVVGGGAAVAAPKQFQKGNKQEGPSPLDNIISQIENLEIQTNATAQEVSVEKQGTEQDKSDLTAAGEHVDAYKNNGQVDVNNIGSLVSEGDEAINRDSASVDIDQTQAAEREEAKVSSMEEKIDFIEQQEGRAPESIASGDIESAKSEMGKIEGKHKKKSVFQSIKNFFEKLIARLSNAKGRAATLKNRLVRKSQEAFMSAIGLNPKIKAMEGGINNAQKEIPKEIAARDKEKKVVENFAKKVAEFKAVANSEKGKEA